MSSKKYCSKCGAELVHTTKQNKDINNYDVKTGKKVYPQPVYNYYKCPNAGLFNAFTFSHDSYNDEPDPVSF